MKNLNLILAIVLLTIMSCETNDKYHCVSGYCETGFSEGYNSYTDCNSECGNNNGGGSNGGYNCVSGDCIYSSSGGTYSSSSSCENSCSGGGGGGNNCDYIPYYGAQNCNDPGYVSVGNGLCCPPNAPYYCPNASLCYTTCEAAEANGCNGNTVFGTGQTSGGGGNNSGYNCISGNCVYSSTNGTYGTLSSCESSCQGSGYGDVTFWTESDLACGTITVVLNGSSRTITSYYYNGLSSCNASGCANYNLPAGTYSYTASCTGYSWTGGTVTVTTGGCLRLELY